MKTRTLVMMVAFLAAMVILPMALCSAADDDAKVTATGAVTVTKNDDGGVTAVKVTAGETVYNIVLNDNGKKVGEMAGKKVTVIGTVEEKDGAKWMTVESVKEVKEEKEE